MRVLLTATMVASVLVIGPSMAPGQALPPGGNVATGQQLAQTVQQKEKGAVRPGHTRRHDGQRGYKGSGRGFVGSCQWLRARALTSHNPIWWRKYRQQCVGR